MTTPESQARPIRERRPTLNPRDAEFTTKWVSIALAGLATMGILQCMYPTSGPQLPSESTEPQKTPSQLSDHSSPSEPSHLSQIVNINLTRPESKLVAGLRDMFDREGKIVEFFDCSELPNSISKTVVNTVNLREAPSRIARAITQLEQGERKHFPIEAIVKSLYVGKSSTERWLAAVEGNELSFAAKEEALRTYLVNTWGIQANCKPISTSYDYLQSQPPITPTK